MFFSVVEYDFSNPDSLPHVQTNAIVEEMNKNYEKAYDAFIDMMGDRREISNAEYLKLIDEIVEQFPQVERWKLHEVIEWHGWKNHYEIEDGKFSAYRSMD